MVFVLHHQHDLLHWQVKGYRLLIACQLHNAAACHIIDADRLNIMAVYILQIESTIGRVGENF